MTRAEEAALKAYPNVEQPVWDKSHPKTLFVRHTERNAFIQGYEQAEKDLALTAGKIKKILDIAERMQQEGQNSGWFPPEWYGTEQFYEELLKRYKQ